MYTEVRGGIVCTTGSENVTFAGLERLLVMEQGVQREEVWRSLGWLGGGCLLIVLCSWSGFFSGVSPRSPAGLLLWACDRDGGALVGFDEDGFVVEERRASRPLEVAASGAGVTWLLEAVGPGGSAGRTLLRLDSDAKETVRVHYAAAAGLRAGPRGGVRLIHGVGPERVWSQLNSEGRVDFQYPAPAAIGWEPLADGVVLVRQGGVSAYSWSPLDPPCRPWLDAPFQPESEVLAHASRPDGIWLLLQREGQRIIQGRNAALGVDLECPLPAWPVASEGAWLLAHGGPDVLWIVGRSGHALRLNLMGGRQRWCRAPGPIQDLRCIAEELWCASPAGLLRFDSWARGLPGQGGFDFLIGVDRVPPVD